MNERMPVLLYKKIALLLLCMVLILPLLSGCTRDIYKKTGTTPDTSATEAPASEGEDPTTPVGDAASPDSAPAPAADEAPVTAVFAQAKDTTVEKINVYYDATMAMMGFVDVPTTTSSAYVAATDAVRTSSIFPNAQVHIYRVDRENASGGPAEISVSDAGKKIGAVSFYVSHDTTTEPDLIQLTGEASAQPGRRLSTFLTSYYTLTGQSEPAGEQCDSPVASIFEQLDPNAVSVIISDMSELTLDQSRLIRALKQNVLEDEMSFAVIGVRANFAGFAAVKESSRIVWTQWGSLPSSSQQAELHYKNGNAEYFIPVSEDPSERTTAQRPFYILCIGKTSQLSNYVAALMTSLRQKVTDAPIGSAIYPLSFADGSYQLGQHVTPQLPIAKDSSGSSAVADAQKLGVVRVAAQQDGLPFYQLGKPYNGVTGTRTVAFSVDYAPGQTDPRVTANSFTSSDFVGSLKLYAMDEQGNVAEVETPSQASVTIGQVSKDGRSIQVICNVPTGMVAKGRYRASLSLAVKQPETHLLAASLSDFATQASSDSTFDGSRTMGLQSLLSECAQIQSQRDQAASLGSYEFDIQTND